MKLYEVLAVLNKGIVYNENICTEGLIFIHTAVAGKRR
jgi:hypothetical protein